MVPPNLKGLSDERQPVVYFNNMIEAGKVSIGYF
jgi:hypothetical protein